MKISHLLCATMVLVCSAWSLQAGGAKAGMTFRVHVQVQAGTESAGQVLQVALSNPEQVITVNRLPSLTEKHLATVMPTPDGGMIIQTHGTGTRLLEEVTTSNSGRIMVVLLNGTVVYAPLIDMPLRTGRMLVPGPIPPEVVTALQTQINKSQKQ